MKVSKGKSVSSAATAVLAAAAAADSSDEATTTDLFVESQIAGEGSDEKFSPPSPMPSDSKSPLRKTRTSAVAAAAAAATTNRDITILFNGKAKLPPQKPISTQKFRVENPFIRLK